MISWLTMTSRFLLFCTSKTILNRPYLINPSLFNRHFSTYECSLLQLSDDMDYIYNDLLETTYFSMSLYRKSLIQQKITSGNYVLSPLTVLYIKNEDLSQFLYDTLPHYPDITFEKTHCSSLIRVSMPEQDDVLVYMGLSRLLLRLTYGSLPEDGYRLEDIKLDSFYNDLKSMGKVGRVYKLDLGDSCRMIQKSLILDIVKHSVEDSQIYKLITSYLHIPIIENGCYTDSCNGIPPAGEIMRVLFNLVLMEIFDREFTKRFPSIAFTRYLNEVFLSTSESETDDFNENAGYALLEELNLAGKIQSIRPGDDPIMCYGQILFINSDSQVCVSRKPKEYNF